MTKNQRKKIMRERNLRKIHQRAYYNISKMIFLAGPFSGQIIISSNDIYFLNKFGLHKL
jgi:hypothetical protein